VSGRWGGLGEGNMYRKIGKEEELSVGESVAPSDDFVPLVGDETAALFRVKMSVVICISEEENGYEANGGSGNKKCVMKD
jgi:hypothetical protein